MKQHHPILAALLMPLLLGGVASAQSQSSQSQSQSSHSESSGNQTSTQKETVTVTSDGKRTIKKTVRMRNGKKEVITEITDENGNTTTTRNGDHQDTQPEAQADGPWLGIRIKEVSPAMRDQLGLPNDQGAVIDLVAPESPAAISGIKKGDLLLTVAGASIGSPDDLSQALAKHKAGDTVTVEIMRRGERMDIEVTLAERPEQAGQDDGPPANAPDGNRKVEIEIDGGAFDSILDNPNVPEDFKKTVRDMQKQMEDFQKQHGHK